MEHFFGRYVIRIGNTLLKAVMNWEDTLALEQLVKARGITNYRIILVSKSEAR